MESNPQPSHPISSHLATDTLPPVPMPTDEDPEAPLNVIDPALLCSNECAHLSMQNPPTGKCDGECRKRFFEEANNILNQLEQWQAAKNAAKKEEQAKKRRPGGQPGNQNARKYDLHPRRLAPKEWAMVQEYMANENLDLREEISLLRVRYLQLIVDPDASPKEIAYLVHAMTSMLKTQALIDKIYHPLEENEENNENDSTPDSRLKT